MKLNNKWFYLYRVVYKKNNIFDFFLRTKRDALAAKALKSHD